MDDWTPVCWTLTPLKKSKDGNHLRHENNLMWIWFKGQFNKTITSVKILWGNLPQVIEFLPDDFQIHTEKENWQSLVRERLNGRQVEKMSKELAQGSFNFRLLIILICNALTVVAKEDTKLSQPSRRLWEVSFFRQIVEAHAKPREARSEGVSNRRKI